MVVRKVIEVDWFDAQSSINAFTLEEIQKHLKPIHTKSVGYLLYEHKDYIVIGFTDFGNGLIKHHQVIPIGMIKKITVLRDGKK